MSKAKIFVIYHQPDNPILSDIYQPICVGKRKGEFSKDFLRDDVGENISEKNDKYNELTAIYWVYKHIDEFPGVEYIGFDHYRRLFCFNETKKTAFVKKNTQEILIKIDDKRLESLFENYDFVVPFPSHYESVRAHFEKSHNSEDLGKLLESIKKVRPDMLESAESYLENRNEYLYNMFVFKKKMFLEYCDFLFSVLNDFVTSNDSQRLYVSERLTGIYVWKLIQDRKKPLYLPVLHIRSKSLKAANKLVKKNFKENTDRGFVYKIKPLILCLLPRHLEQWFRRRKTR